MNRSSPPIFPDRFHWWLGRVVYITAIATILFGMYHITYSMTPWFLLLLWIVATIGNLKFLFP